MFIGITVGIIVILFLWYVMAGREWLKKQPWAQGFFAKIEALEIALYRKSETLLVGRLIWLCGLVVTFYDGIALFISSLDITPLTKRIFDALQIPPDMRSLTATAFIGLLGMLISWMRKRATKPIELVAVPDKVVAENPRVAEAVAMADATKEEAVAVTVVAEAKAAQT